MRRLRYVVIAVACVSMAFGIVLAQDNAFSGGTLRGQITDLTPAQNPVEGVEVKVVAQDGGKEFITKTDADGNYKHARLPAGRYLISISKEGYNEREGKPVTIVNGGDHFVPLKMSQKGKIEPFFDVQRDERMKIIVKQRIASLLERVAESVGTRYNLDEAISEALHQSILNSIEGASAQNGDLSIFAKPAEEGNMSLIETILSHPGCQAEFEKHLSETQFKDYLEFTEARRQRDRQAVANWITATLDKELSLKPHQREQVLQSLLDAADNELFPTAMNALVLNPQQAVQLAHYRLRVALEGVLSEAQSKVWQGLVSAKAPQVDILIVAPEVGIRKVIEAEKINEGDVAAPNKTLVFIPNEPDEHIGIEKEVEVVIDNIVIDQQGKQPWMKLNPDKVASPEQMMEIAEAKLVAHTELLGALDERATRRLALVTKGAVQQHFEAQNEISEAISREVEADLMKKVEDGKMPPEEAAAMLNFVLESAVNELSRDGGPKVHITRHPLYQQAIKDALSEEAFARYSEHQTERASLHQEALRNIVVACMDTQLLLDDPQRETLETAASALIPAPLSEKSAPIMMFFQLFPQTVDFEVLTPWQQGEFERVFGPIMWRR